MRYVCLGLVMVASVMWTPEVASAMEDPIEAELAQAELEYVKAVQAARDKLIGELKKREEAAQKVGNLQLLVTIQTEIEAFETKGNLPKSVSTRAYEIQVQREQVKLDKVFFEGIQQYTKAGEIELAKSAQQQLEKLKSGLFQVKKPAAIVIFNPVSTGTMGKESLVFTNRDYQWKVVPSEIEGWRFTKHAIRQPPVYNIEVKQSGMLYVAFSRVENLQNEEFFLRNGWQKIDLGEKQYNYLFMKSEVPKGKFRIPSAHPHSGTILIFKDQP